MAAYMHATCACIKDISVNTQTKGLTLLCVVMPTDATSKRKETPERGFPKRSTTTVKSQLSLPTLHNWNVGISRGTSCT